MNKNEQKRQIHSYNALRGICAVGILFSHMSYLGKGVNPFWSYLYLDFMKYGSRCTSFFFILSGFLAAYTWKATSFKKFMKGKLKRIYPLTIMVFLLALVCSFVLNDTVNEGIDVGERLWVLSVILNPLLLKAYVPIESVFYSFHGPSWYVSALFGFYIIAYYQIKKLNAMDKRKADLILGYEILAVYAVQFVVCLLVDLLRLEEMRLYLTYVNPYFRILGEGMVGIFLCRKMPDIQEALASFSATWLEIIAVAFFAADFLINNYVSSSIYSAWIQVFPMSFLLIAFYEDKGAVSKCFQKKGWQELGNISFELYMTHAFVYEGLPVIAKALNKGLGEWFVYHAGTRFIITFFACIVFAVIVHVQLNCILRRSVAAGAVVSSRCAP